MYKVSSYQSRRRVKNAVAVAAIVLILLLIIPVACVLAYSYEYGWQGKAADGDQEYNSVVMLRSPTITVNQVPGNYFLNTIQESIDGSKRIDFLFTMTAGMNNLQLSNFKNNSMEFINIYRADGRHYDGTWKDPIVKYSGGSGKLKVGESNSFSNKDRNDPKSGQINLYLDKETLKDGRYILEFGEQVCGNNTEKVLGCPVAFYFTVGTEAELTELIGQIDVYLKTCEAGTSPGQYPAAQLATLKTALEKARLLSADSSQQGQWKKAAEELNSAFQTFKNSRMVLVNTVKVINQDKHLAVGTKGKAEAMVVVKPDESQYQSVTWKASDNITIDAESGAFTVDYPDDHSWIKAISAVDSSVTSDSSGGTWKFKAQGESRFFTVNIPKGKTLQQVLEKSGMPSPLTMLKVITEDNGTITNTDVSYISKELKALKGIDLSQTGLKSVPGSLFAGNKALEEIYLPDGLSAIGSKSFYQCQNLNVLDLPAGLKTIDDQAFAGCTSLPARINVNGPVPPEMTTAFQDSSVEGFIVPYGCSSRYKQTAGWKNYQIDQLQSQRKLTVSLSKTGGLKDATGAALEKEGTSDGKIDCLTIKTISGVQLDYVSDVSYLQNHFAAAAEIDLSACKIQDKKIKSNTFSNRTSLKKIRLPEDIITIGDSAFSGCKNLTDIILPARIEKIGNLAFTGCKSLPAAMIINGTTPAELVPTAIDNEVVKTFYVPGTAVKAYKASPGWKDFIIKPQVEIKLSASSMKIKTGTKKTLKAAVTVHNGNSKAVKWTSSNKAVAQVSSSGVILARKAGAAVVTATAADGGSKATCKVTVVQSIGPKVTAAVTYNSVKLKWSQVSGVNGYIVYRATSKKGPYNTLRTVSSKTTRVTDAGLITGKTYYYKVRTYRNTGGIRYLGAYSAIIAAKPIPKKLPK